MVLIKRFLGKLDNLIIQCIWRSFNKENSVIDFVCNFVIFEKLEIIIWKEKIWFIIDFSIVIDNLRIFN